MDTKSNPETRTDTFFNSGFVENQIYYEIDTNGFLHEVNNEMCIKWYSDNKIDIQFQKWEV